MSEEGGPPDAGPQTYTPPVFDGPPLVLSILPVESAGALYERFVPLRYYLERSLKRPVTITIAKDYESAITGIGTGAVHLAFLDPATYCEVRKQYGARVVPLVTVEGREGAASRSVLIARQESPIQKPADARGRRLALGNQQSSFSYLIPVAMLSDVGLSLKDFSRVDYLQQEDRVALSVLIGDHDLGGISESVARKYLPDGLKVLKASESIPRFVLSASSSLDEKTRQDVSKALTSISDAAIATSIDRDAAEFTSAADRDFDMIRVMIKNIRGTDYIEYGPKTIKVAILPLYSPITIYDRYEPLMRYLSGKTGYEFKLVIPRNFEEFVEVVRRGDVDFSYQNPYVLALLGRDVAIKPLVTTVGEDCVGDEPVCGEDRFRGVIITRADSPVRDIRDLMHKRVMVVSRKSAGGYLSQMIYLRSKGIDVEKDFKIIDAKRQESVILGVYRGEAEAGFVRESALAVWREEVDMNKIRILAGTSYLPNWPFASCRQANPPLVAEVKRLLSELRDKEVLKAAGIKGFKPANEAEFEALKGY